MNYNKEPEREREIQKGNMFKKWVRQKVMKRGRKYYLSTEEEERWRQD